MILCFAISSATYLSEEVRLIAHARHAKTRPEFHYAILYQAMGNFFCANTTHKGGDGLHAVETATRQFASQSHLPTASAYSPAQTTAQHPLQSPGEACASPSSADISQVASGDQRSPCVSAAPRPRETPQSSRSRTRPRTCTIQHPNQRSNQTADKYYQVAQLSSYYKPRTQPMRSQHIKRHALFPDSKAQNQQPKRLQIRRNKAHRRSIHFSDPSPNTLSSLLLVLFPPFASFSLASY